ncbi:MAG: hypothetical protein QOI31_304 [Solirubrobacterales bacterium]|nr:hypothetical protein [Solirubrobacterales bacterium]
MTTPNGDRISLRLELDKGSEPLSGRLYTADGTDEEFSGWLALAAAIERVVHIEETNKEAVR